MHLHVNYLAEREELHRPVSPGFCGFAIAEINAKSSKLRNFQRSLHFFFFMIADFLNQAKSSIFGSNNHKNLHEILYGLTDFHRCFWNFIEPLRTDQLSVSFCFKYTKTECWRWMDKINMRLMYSLLPSSKW